MIDETNLDTALGVTIPSRHARGRMVRIGPALDAILANHGYPPVINTRRETQVAYRAAMNVVGAAGMVVMDYPSMGAEDFSFYLEQVPGCYVRFGARIREDEYLPLHSPSFDINEEVLRIGAAYFDEVAREALRAVSG